MVVLSLTRNKANERSWPHSSPRPLTLMGSRIEAMDTSLLDYLPGLIGSSTLSPLQVITVGLGIWGVAYEHARCE